LSRFCMEEGVRRLGRGKEVEKTGFGKRNKDMAREGTF
jgi:hypothetical protein